MLAGNLLQLWMHDLAASAVRAEEINNHKAPCQVGCCYDGCKLGNGAGKLNIRWGVGIRGPPAEAEAE